MATRDGARRDVAAQDGARRDVARQGEAGSTRRTALIIGGGIGGLATALGLRSVGWDVRVFERRPALTEVGAGIALWANGLRALDRLGVGDAVRGLGRFHDGGAIRDARGGVLIDLSTPDSSPGDSWLGCMIHRADLLSTLADAVGADVIHTNADFVDAVQRAGRVEAHFEDGTRAEGDILIGADGIHSAVRSAMLGEVALRYAGYTIWRWVADFPTERTVAGESWGRGARFGLAALPHGRVYAYAAADAPPGRRSADGEKAELNRIFGTWHDPIPGVIAAADEASILRHDCYDLPPQRVWGVGRCTLLGDAAHAMTPNLGQGACQALEDAVILGRWLRDAADPEGALRGYEHERRLRAVRFQKRSWSAGVVGQGAHPVAVRSRDFLARHVLSRVQGAQMRQMMEVDL